MPINRAPTGAIPTYAAHLLTIPVGPGHPIFDDEYQTWRRLEAPHEEAKTEATKACTDILGDAGALERWTDAHPELPSSAEQAFTDAPDTEPPPPPEPASTAHTSREPTFAETLLTNRDQIATYSSADAIGSAHLMFVTEPGRGNHEHQAMAAALLAARVDPDEYTAYPLAHPAPFRGGPLWARYAAEERDALSIDGKVSVNDAARAEAAATARLEGTIQGFDWKAWFGLRQLTIDGNRDPVATDGDGGPGVIGSGKPAPKKRGRKSKAELAAIAAAGPRPPEAPAPRQRTPKKNPPVAAPVQLAPGPGAEPAAPTPHEVAERLQGLNPEAVGIIDADPEPFPVPPATFETTEDREAAERRIELRAKATELFGVANEIAGLLGDVAPWQRLAVLELVDARLAAADAQRRIDNMLGNLHPDHPFTHRHRDFDTDAAVLRIRDHAESLANSVRRIQAARVADR